MSKERTLSGIMDAEVWAEEFMQTIEEHGPIDVDLMRAWFANAIMTGYDHGERRRKTEAAKHLLGDPPGSHWVYDRDAYEAVERFDHGLSDESVPGSPMEKAVGAALFAVRAATMFGTEDRIDPDALIQAFKRAWLGPDQVVSPVEVESEERDRGRST